MTLLELLRQELPKRGGWPEGVNFIAQEEEGSVWGFVHKPEKDEDDEWMDSQRIGSHKLLGHLPQACDHTTAIVTSEQYEATGWDGTGLPPVGVECEVSVDGGRSWCTYKAINEKNGARLIEIGNFTEEFQSNNWIFRPLRTEAERAIDEMVRLSGVSIGAAKILYDAGYRKG